MRNGLNRSIIVGAVLAFWFGGYCEPATDANDLPSQSVRRIFVPANAPEAWPKGDWEPWPRTRFEETLRDVDEQSKQRPQPSIRSAHYEAVFANDRLVDGRFRWSLSLPRAASTNTTDSASQIDILPNLQSRIVTPRFGESFLNLEDCNLPINGLEWNRHPDDNITNAGLFTGVTTPRVIWGRDNEGRLGVLISGNNRRLDGQFAVDGHKLGDTVRFDLRLPPSPHSLITLRVPANWTVASTDGIVTEKPPEKLPEKQFAALDSQPVLPSKSQWSVWSIEVGKSHRVRLQLTQRASRIVVAPVVTLRPDLSFTVRAEAARFRAQFDVAVLEGEVEQLQFVVPSTAEISQVTYGDSTVQWNRDITQPDRLSLSLPEPGAGSLRRIEMLGYLPGPTESGWQLPLFHGVDCVELEGHIAVRLALPFRTAAIHSHGLRQFVYDSSPIEGEVFEFRRTQSDATLEFIRDDVASRLACQTLCLFDENDAQNVQAIVEWTASEGRVWSTSCFVPADWEVVDINSIGDTIDDNVFDWSIDSGGSEQQRLVLHFHEAISPVNGQMLVVQLRRQSSTGDRATPILLLQPEAKVSCESFVLTRGRRQIAPASSTTPWPSEVLTRLPVEDLPTSFKVVDWIQRAINVRSEEIQAFRINNDDRHAANEWTVVEDGLITRAATAPVPMVTEQNSHKPSTTIVPLIRTISAQVELCGEESGYDQYRLFVELIDANEEFEFPWEFSDECDGISVRLDGKLAIPLKATASFHQGITLTRPAVRLRERHLEFRYRVAATNRWGPIRRDLLFPRFSCAVLESHVDINLSQSLKIVASPQGLVSNNTNEPSRWVLPLKGPMGRTPDEVLFNPLNVADWQRLIWGSREESLEEDANRETHWIGSSLDLPSKIEIVVWNRDEAACINWLAFLATIWFGLILRIRWHDRPLRIVAMAMALGIVGAVLLPPVFAQVQGSGFAGLLVSQVIPTAWLRLRRISSTGTVDAVRQAGVPYYGQLSSPTSNMARPVSQLVSFIGIAVYLMTFGWGAGLFGFDISDTRFSLGSVLIPYDEDSSEHDTDIVYVSHEFRERTARVLAHDPHPKWLIESIDYTCNRESAGREVLQTEIAVWLDPHARSIVPLPFSNCALDKQGACLVNGHAHELEASLDGHGFEFTWTPESKSVLDDSDRPVPPELPGENSGRLERIVLQLRLIPLQETTNRSVIRVALPVAGVCRLHPPPNGPGRIIRFTDSAPEPAQSTSEPFQIVHSSTASILEFASSQAKAAVPTIPTRVEAWALGDLDGSAISLRCWGRYIPGSTPVSWVTWEIPPGMAIRQIEAPGLQSQIIGAEEAKGRYLDLHFETPHTEPFEVQVELLMPLAATQFELRFPDLAINQRVGVENIEMRHYRAALRHSPDRRVQVSSPFVDHPMRNLSVDELNRDGRFGEVIPNIAFELDDPLSWVVLIQATGNALRGTVEQQIRLLAERIEWSMTIDGLHATSPSFQYELDIDPNLRVTSATVTEQDSNRLAHWSQVGGHVTLFLNARASGKQRLAITGEMPTKAPIRWQPVAFAGLVSPSERRLMIASRNIRVQFEQGGTRTDLQNGNQVLLDTLSSPTDPWPQIVKLEQLPKPVTDKPPEPPTQPQRNTPVDVNRTSTEKYELGEANLVRTQSGGVRGKLRLWTGRGGEAEVDFQVPDPLELLSIRWNGDSLPLILPRSGFVRCVLPARDKGGILELDWDVPAISSPQIPSPWGEAFPKIVWPVDSTVERLVVTWSNSADSLLALQAPFRRADLGFALDQRQLASQDSGIRPDLSHPAGVAVGSEVAIGSQKAIHELSRSGSLNGITWLDWPRAKPMAGGLLFFILTLLLWWSSKAVYWLQARTGICSVVMGGLWWLLFEPSGLGCLLCILSLPFAIRDLIRERRLA